MSLDTRLENDLDDTERSLHDLLVEVRCLAGWESDPRVWDTAVASVAATMARLAALRAIAGKV